MHRSTATPWPQLIGIFLLSMATLLLELALTRVLSVSLWYHFGFLIISTALLGFGAAGVTLSLWKGLREELLLEKALAVLSLLFGLGAVLSFWLMQQIPFDPFSLLADSSQLLYMPLYYLAIATPFYGSGLAIGLLLSRGGTWMNRLYAYDLAGAGLGCAAIALVMPSLGGSGSVVAAADLGALAATAFGWQQARKLAWVGLAMALGLSALAFQAEEVLPISVSVNKTGKKGFPPGVTVRYTAWNTFSRVDVYGRESSPEKPGFRRFIIDAGTAGTGIPDLRQGVPSLLRAARAGDKKALEAIDPRAMVACTGKTHPKVLIIGSGGGAEVLSALYSGATSITAVEINPIIVDVETNRMKEYWGGLFEQPGVQLVNDEGRSFIRRSKETYDVIISSHTISNAAVASGALSLAENYVLTKEAFEDYYNHLSPNGTLFFTRPEIQIARLFSTATQVLREKGIGEPARHLFAYKDPDMKRDGKQYAFIAGFLMKKSPITPEEVSHMEKTLGIGIKDTTSEAPIVLYSPFEEKRNSIYQQIVRSDDLPALYRENAIQLAPATDDRPFFNQRTRWSGLTADSFRKVFTQEDRARMALEDQPVAEITLVIILLQSVIIAAILILLPLFRFSRQGPRVPHRWAYLTYFAGLGLGFIMIEIAFLQRFSLFLGQPVYTYAVVLASLLLSTGVGAYLSERIGRDPQRALRRIIPMLLGILLLTALLMPVLFQMALGWALPFRVLVSVLLVVPCGILLGIPFPTGLRLVATEGQALLPWAWGVNGFFTVIGSVCALMLGMAFGFLVILALAGLFYGAALLAISKIKQKAHLPSQQAHAG